MSFSLSAAPRPIPATRQRTLLLMASVALHAAVLIPIALNTVFIPSFEDESPFEVWLDMQPRPKPEPEPVREHPLEKPLPQVTERTPLEAVKEPEVIPEPEKVPERQRPVEERLQQQQQSTLTTPDRALPQIQQPKRLESQSLNTGSSDTTAPLDPMAIPDVSATLQRPHIEAIDGPASQNQSLSPTRSLPSVTPKKDDSAGSEGQNQSAASNTASDSIGANDTPIPRRARISDEDEAALAAAAAGGALDDAWTYRPEAGGAAPGGGASGGGASGGGVQGNTATSTGRIYYGGRTTPVDCTQPKMLSDVQRLSCDSAEQRRIRSAIERGVRVMGTGNDSRDGQLGAIGGQRIQQYEERRRPLAGGTGVPVLDTTGSGRGAELDALSGTDREVSKIQQQIGASNGPRAPAPPPSSAPRD